MKFPTFPKGSTRKQRRKIMSEFKQKLSPQDRLAYELEKKRNRKSGRRKYEPIPLPETPLGFSKEELKQVDWSNT
ncbi:hypothetical protein [Ruegeria arenilitoris]|uniref:hypothetical protein n=1 Tax=Ruegeria arenilitoris TaxID=1173585 RepID=UPI00147AD98D|nr:hypothetical protein [Ruegeria arenilitoris]